MKITLAGIPRTKKNSQKIIVAGSYPKIIPSDAYKEYERLCLEQLRWIWRKPAITEAVNLECVYYMPTRRKCDLVNLEEATCDILVAGGVLQDDNYAIVASLDGSRVAFDKGNPRVEITITEKEQRA